MVCILGNPNHPAKFLCKLVWHLLNVRALRNGFQIQFTYFWEFSPIGPLNKSRANSSAPTKKDYTTFIGFDSSSFFVLHQRNDRPRTT